MSWSERIRRLSTLSPWTALLMAALGCGGGDKNPTGPGGGGGGGGDVAELELVRLGLVGLPADAQVEDCTLTRFYGGGIAIDQKTGRWEITLQVHDDNYGDWGYRDQGETEVDGNTVWFDSEISGTSHAGTVNGPEVKIMYDWCENGVADVQLVFDR
jgi:hypothetical protein